MMRAIPKARVPVVAAWLAADGHDLLTAPAGLVQLALEDAPVPYWEPDFDPRSRRDPDEPARDLCWY